MFVATKESWMSAETSYLTKLLEQMFWKNLEEKWIRIHSYLQRWDEKL